MVTSVPRITVWSRSIFFLFTTSVDVVFCSTADSACQNAKSMMPISNWHSSRYFSLKCFCWLPAPQASSSPCYLRHGSNGKIFHWDLKAAWGGCSTHMPFEWGWWCWFYTWTNHGIKKAVFTDFQKFAAQTEPCAAEVRQRRVYLSKWWNTLVPALKILNPLCWHNAENHNCKCAHTNSGQNMHFRLGQPHEVSTPGRFSWCCELST